MFYFLHLHKCAGTTFVDLAGANGVALFEPNANGNPLNPLTGARFRFWEWPEPEQRHFLSSSRYALVANEYELGPEHRFYDGVVYFVILRDPIDRMLSHFEWRHRHKLDLEKSAKKRAKQFLKHIESEQPWWAENYFVKTFTEREAESPDKLAVAKERLANFDHIFFMDRFNEDMSAMQTYGWQPDDRQRKSLERGGVPRSTVRDALKEFRSDLNEITERNAADFELYEYARTLSEARTRSVPLPKRASALGFERPDSASFEFNLYCAHEAYCAGRKDESATLLAKAMKSGIPESLEIQSGEFVKTALARFEAPAATKIRKVRKKAKQELAAAKDQKQEKRARRKLEKAKGKP